jgi:hypothetical protein
VGGGEGGSAISAVTAARSRALAIPAAVWVAAIVGVSLAVRAALGGRMAAPWIMVDEIVYSELAKNVAAHGQFLVRGVPSNGYGFVYPVLIAPAWRLFGSIPAAYTAAKTINAVLMSLTAVPAYLLARRVLHARLALFAAALSVLVPSMLYTGMLMTENAFYPLFVLAAYLLVRMLERPTALLQVALLAVCGIAFECRAQAVALLPAIACAPFLLALVERQGLRTAIRRFAVLYAIIAGGAALAVLGTAARGRSPLTLLGAYRAAASSTYTVSGVAHFFLYHLAELDLYLGILPFAALAALWLAPRQSSPAGRAFAVASLSVSVWLLAEVSAFASASYVNRIEERNMFYLAPFALIAVLALGEEGLITRARRPLLLAAGAAGVLPFFIPYTRFITTSAVSDTFALLPWWWAQDHLIHLPQVRFAALGVSLAAAALFVALPRRYALVLPALVALYFLATTFVVENGRHGIHKATLGSLFAGIQSPHPDWIDRSVGRNASVAILWTGTMPSPYPVWENEFFNRSVRTVYDLDNAQRPDPLPETNVSRRPDGVLESDGHTVDAQYVLASGTTELAGTVIAHDPVGVDLYRVEGPIVILTHVSGIYSGDTWSGRTVIYQRVECAGGRVEVKLQGDEQLFATPQTVVATEAGVVVGRTSIPINGPKWLTVPLHPTANGRCVVDFTVGRTRVPAQVEHGSIDKRALGAHFLTFVYLR